MIRFSRFYIIELTFKCNTQCEYCYLRENRTDIFNKEMDFITFKNIIDNITGNYILNNQREIAIVLHGGEPLLLGFNKLKEFIEYMMSTFDKYGVVNRSISIQTNGILLEKNIINLLNSYNISIGLSYDGVNSARIKSSEINENIVKNIKYMKENKVGFGIVSVIHKKNIDQFKKNEILKYTKPPKLIPIYDTLNDDSLKISLIDFFNTFEKEKIDNFEAFSPYRGDSDINRIAPKVLIDLLTDNVDNCENTCNFKFCGSGLSICAIGPTGEITTCDRFNIEFFNKFRLKAVKDYDFLGVHQLKRALDFNLMLHEIQKSNGCDLCYARKSCNFDCQALHYSRYKQFGLDPRICAYTKAVYKYIYNNLDKILDYFIQNEKALIIQELKVLNIKPRIKRYIKEEFKANILIDRSSKPQSLIFRRIK